MTARSGRTTLTAHLTLTLETLIDGAGVSVLELDRAPVRDPAEPAHGRLHGVWQFAREQLVCAALVLQRLVREIHA